MYVTVQDDARSGKEVSYGGKPQTYTALKAISASRGLGDAVHA